MGIPSSTTALAASLKQPGQLSFKKIHVFTQVSKRGDQMVVAPEYSDIEELVEAYFYVIEHPEKGVFLIDAGMPSNYKEMFGFVLKKLMTGEDVNFHTFTDDWLKQNEQTTPRGVFLTHLHFEHMMGVAALPVSTPIYVGPRDGSPRDLLIRIVGSPTDSALKGRPPLQEFAFTADDDGAFDGILDIFGDGNLWAIHTPGHSPGSIAYLVNSTEGPKLVTGDTLRLGLEWTTGLQDSWDTEETAPITAKSAAALKKFVAQHSGIEVHLGHQELRPNGTANTQNTVIQN